MTTTSIEGSASTKKRLHLKCNRLNRCNHFKFYNLIILKFFKKLNGVKEDWMVRLCSPSLQSSGPMWTWGGSNSWPLACKASALPAELQALKFLGNILTCPRASAPCLPARLNCLARSRQICLANLADKASALPAELQPLKKVLCFKC